jgi:kynurenine formamidase
VHQAVLGADKYQIENMVLDDVPATNVVFVSLPINIEGAPEAEARVMAIVK